MENNVKLFGSHDSMTYLKPNFRGLQWLLWPFMMIGYYVVARCQSKDIYEQFKSGVRVFDLRMCSRKYTMGGLYNWIFAHGVITLDENVRVYDVINELYMLAKENQTRVYVRLILERCKDVADEMNFIDFCHTMRSKFSDKYIVFFGGNRKSDWKKLYLFPKKDHDFNDINNNQWVSSMTTDARWYEKICPYLYAKRMNSTNFNKMSYLTNLFDFVPVKS